MIASKYWSNLREKGDYVVRSSRPITISSFFFFGSLIIRTLLLGHRSTLMTTLDDHIDLLPYSCYHFAFLN